MTTSQTWWVIFHEPNPAAMTITAVEPAPEGDAAHENRLAQLQKAGQRAYVIDAPDVDTAGDIAGRVWAEELVSSPARLAAADAYIAKKPTT
ncbi:hypothetical protein K1Y78_26560 [Streptomyces sp. tea 10]|nr:hypothetical protein [Streptomyces sp. tea 10]